MKDDVTIAKCPLCDAPGELLPDWQEHDRKVKHADDHRKPWERCPLAGQIVELHWWNRRPNPETQAVASVESVPVSALRELEKELLNYKPAQTDIAVVETYREGVGRGLAIAADRLSAVIRETKT